MGRGNCYFDYDDNGNLIIQSGTFDDITYDHRNLPTEFFLSDTDTTVKAGYNADGQRILKEVKDGAWSFYVMDGMQTLAVIESGTLSHINLLAGGTFGRVDVSGGAISNRRYYITDHLGSTRAVVDETGQVLDTFDYYPFGLKMPGRTTDNSGTLERFTGKERDDEGGLNLDYFGARYYDPAIGRWQSVDPLTHDFPAWSPYNYTLGNPINLFDPDGKAPCCLLPIGVAATRDNVAAAYGDQEAQQRVKYRLIFYAGVASLAIPGPEDLALGAFLVTKAGQATLRFADEAAGLVKGLFRSGDEVSGISTKIGSKIEKQLETRGWSESSMADLIANPSKTKSVRDTRWMSGGKKLDDPATAFIDKDGSYVIRNNNTGDIVQISNRNDPNWRAPWEKKE